MKTLKLQKAQKYAFLEKFHKAGSFPKARENPFLGWVPTYATVHTFALKLENKITQKYFQIFIMELACAPPSKCDCVRVCMC